MNFGVKNFLGSYFTLLIGPTKPVAVKPMILDAIEKIEVTHSDSGRSGFQIILKAERSDMFGRVDYPLLKKDSPLKIGNRVKILVNFKWKKRKIIDGFIAHMQLNPGNSQEDAIVTITGEDIGLILDRKEKQESHDDDDAHQVATQLIRHYSSYDLKADIDVSLRKMKPAPAHVGSDLDWFNAVAEKNSYVFYIDTEASLSKNIVYLGEKKTKGIEQTDLAINMGPFTNVEKLDFQYDGLKPVKVSGKIQDSETNKEHAINESNRSIFQVSGSLKKTLTLDPWISRDLQKEVILKEIGGVTITEATRRAKAIMNDSNDAAVVAEGELDVSRYGDVLRARAMVKVRGAGVSYDGNYYVKRVQHLFGNGEYKQQFTLTRDAK